MGFKLRLKGVKKFAKKAVRAGYSGSTFASRLVANRGRNTKLFDTSKSVRELSKTSRRGFQMVGQAAQGVKSSGIETRGLSTNSIRSGTFKAPTIKKLPPISKIRIGGNVKSPTMPRLPKLKLGKVKIPKASIRKIKLGGFKPGPIRVPKTGGIKGGVRKAVTKAVNRYTRPSEGQRKALYRRLINYDTKVAKRKTTASIMSGHLAWSKRPANINKDKVRTAVAFTMSGAQAYAEAKRWGLLSGQGSSTSRKATTKRAPIARPPVKKATTKPRKPGPPKISGKVKNAKLINPKRSAEPSPVLSTGEKLGAAAAVVGILYKGGQMLKWW